MVFHFSCISEELPLVYRSKMTLTCRGLHIHLSARLPYAILSHIVIALRILYYTSFYIITPVIIGFRILIWTKVAK